MTRPKAAIALAGALFGTWATARQDDWKPATTRDGSLSLSLPQGWMVADEKDPEYIKAHDEISKSNPALGSAMKSSTNEDQVLMMYDMKDSIDDGQINNLNVIKKTVKGISPNLYEQIGKKILATLPIKGKGEYKTIDLPVGKTLTYTATVVSQQPQGGDVTIDVVGYLFCKGEVMYVVTLSAAEGKMKDKQELYEKIIKTAKRK